MKIVHKYTLGILLGLCAFTSWAQQDPQFTQYMYNTMSVNPGYAGSREVFSITGLYRNQWVGVDGAPTTQTLGIDTPLGKNVGGGLSIINDELGPSQETYVDGNFSYTVNTGVDHKLSFGLKAGVRFLNVDFTEGNIEDPTDNNLQNINSEVLPTVGAGIYYHTNKWYLGFSVPNFFTSDHYDEVQGNIAAERMHYYLIGGYVFDLGASVKFKPAFLAKAVEGAPFSLDLSANFLIQEKLTLGLGYRWDDSVSGLIGFQLTPGVFAGYAYDYTTSELNNYNSGTHEIMVRFDIFNNRRIKSPRFF
ncbi:type IX secretion system membrane protein PorP/SprF [Joostella atrarenae]|uniref:Type IX secretion system membrane protein PorP/SprF n=1 Tax=Joostella atrarenae TaxID=679257 RepID=A0ABS9J3Z7_9FLAO|nr:type IX secretion system membrane protein PorP/SprF [Joostella atrarenae]MCF8715161.1 type IX secretion system membrane protein PorP/SprF [Joostella atrarenae]